MAAIQAGHLYCGPRRGEHGQGWYIPVMDKDGTLKLVDTYVIKSVYSKGDKNVSAAIEQAIEMGSEPHPYTFGRIRCDYYHGYDYVVHCGELPEGFEDVCYLPEWEYVWEGVADEYDGEDIIPYVQLYFEHGYCWNSSYHGVFLKRKGAEKSLLRVLDARIADAYRSMTLPHYNSKWYLPKVEEALADVPVQSPALLMRVRHLREMGELVERMERECGELKRRQRMEMESLEWTSGDDQP